MTHNQFKYLINRLFVEQDIERVDFEESTYADNSLRPTDFINHNDGYILSVYLDEDGAICYSVEENGFLFHHKIDELTQDPFKVYTFLSNLFDNVYCYISSEEDDCCIDEFVRDSFNTDIMSSFLCRVLPCGDMHFAANNVVIYIEDGDWKHEHQYLTHMLGCMGFELVSKEDEPSDSDCYTATHYYRIP